MKKKKSEEKLERLLADFTESLTDEVTEALEVNSEELAHSSEEDISSLIEIIHIISLAIQPRKLPDGFEAKVLQAVHEKFQDQVSAEKIQRVIGMAVTMEEFRKSLFQDISAACRSFGISLTPKELAALRNLKEDSVEEFAGSLDERITKFFPINLP